MVHCTILNGITVYKVKFKVFNVYESTLAPLPHTKIKQKKKSKQCGTIKIILLK